MDDAKNSRYKPAGTHHFCDGGIERGVGAACSNEVDEDSARCTRLCF